MKKTALVYCENQFGLVDGKTATGLIRHSEIYTIVGVIDSSLAGKDTGEELQELIEKNQAKNIYLITSAENPDMPEYYLSNGIYEITKEYFHNSEVLFRGRDDKTLILKIRSN